MRLAFERASDSAILVQRRCHLPRVSGPSL